MYAYLAVSLDDFIGGCKFISGLINIDTSKKLKLINMKQFNQFIELDYKMIK